MVLRKLFVIDSETNGKGPVIFCWQHEGNYLAVTGNNRRVSIVDRQGKPVQQFPLSGTTPAIAMEWDVSGEVLAVIQEKSSTLTLFNMTSKKVDSIDTGMKEVTAMAWSRTGPQLALGNAKGQLLFYHRQTAKKNPVMGTHSKRITSMVWSKHNTLATIGEDKVLAISDAEGTVINSITMKATGLQVAFGEGKDGGTRKTSNSYTVCVNLSGKNLLLQNTKTKDAPVELTFQPKYGAIANFRFFGEGCMLVGFATGYVCVVSTHADELGRELSAFKTHREALVKVSQCRAIQKGCAIGDGVIRVFDLEDNNLAEQKSEKIEIEQLFGSMLDCGWTTDGQILTVSSKIGTVHSFLTKIPVLSDSSGNNVLFLSSLRELTVRSLETDSTLCKIPVDLEPSFVAVGPGTAAVGMNNQVSFYQFSKSGSKAAGSRTYGGIVDMVRLSSTHVAALVEGKVIIHPLNEKTNNAKSQVSLPERDTSGKVTCLAISENFVIFATSNGNINFVSLLDYEVVVDYRHNGNGIRLISANSHGTRVAFIDSSNAAFIFNPTAEVATTIEGFQPNTRGFLWDTAEYGVLVGYDNKHFVTYVYSPNSRHGAACEPVYVMDGKTYTPTAKINTTSVPYGFHPICLYRGSVHCQSSSGSLTSVSLNSHRAVYSRSKSDANGFINNLSLNRLQQAATLAVNSDQLGALAKRALHLLDVEMAVRAYRLLNQPTLVLCLEKIRHIKEKNILLGHVALISGNFNDAQNFFTRSSRPLLALEMRRDLLQWDHALHLAKSLAVDQVPHMSREYAQQLEFRGEYAKALDVFQQGKMTVPTGHASTELDAQVNAAKSHNDVCDAGAARCMIRTGNVRGGVQLATSLSNPNTSLECAKILEGMNQYEEAGALYEQAEQFEKAATLYIVETKNLKAAGRLLPKIKSRNILVMYAKAKETQQHAYADAEQAYTMAQDWDNVVRLKVEYQNDLHGAYVIVRQTRSAEAAAMVAKTCKKRGENGPAVEFLVMAKKIPEAFELAKTTNTMTNYEQALIGTVALKDGVAPPSHRDEFLRIAQYYDEKKKPMIAGEYYQAGAQFAAALDRFINVGTSEAVDKAVEVVGMARSDVLTRKLIDFLMGEKDGEPKDASYIFKLYMALGNYEKAAKTSVLIATKEQELGNYRAAHKALVDTALVLQAKSIRIPNDLRRALMLLHSYLIVKHIVKPLEDQDNATRMLLRVARNIQKFPMHIPTILTSVVLQCVKVDFKASAYEYASIIVQNEKYHKELSDKHRKKVESLIRRRGKEELADPPESMTPCPFCSAPVAETMLDCGSCKNALPFCVVTGKHMILEDWCACPNCKFPALFTPFVKLLKDTPQCPMCEQYVEVNNLAVIRNPDLKAAV